MTLEDKIRKHIVKVNNGSGVLVQPSDKNISYIFTAKHCIQEDEKSAVKTKEEIIVKRIDKSSDSGFESITVREVVFSPDKDVAILQVNYQDGLCITPNINLIEQSERVQLWGFPQQAVKQQTTLFDELQTFTLEMLRREESFYQFRNLSVANYDDVQGYSGGGVFYPVQGDVSLVAIENRMADKSAEHQHIQALPLKLFYDLITENSLPPILPSHMTNIEEVKSKIFKFDNCDNESNFVQAKATLLKIASNYLEKGFCSPNEILSELKEFLLVPKRNAEELINEKLWVALLEIVIIKHLIEEETERAIDIKYLREIFDSVRVIFINSENTWKRFVPNILCTDFSNLKQNGIALLVLIGDKYWPEDPILKIDHFRNAQPDITRGLNCDFHLIDTVDKSPVLTGAVKVVHLAKLHDKCYVDNEFRLQKLRLGQVTDFLMKSYSIYIPKVEENNV
ncbi:ABC-three component system protein [Pseudoalteromonas sp. H105]|uniref:ABC-three component system protein n=1 Tax=Pseudoalteromonas sp. H105 TaxID=1348393 RepID=UPI0007321518|nr:ABC-three component system protein [Pseudoalteromonas sp. H105]KTF14782.1 hypothetical protein ATS75_11740 [Pseudoalteromonas sp. H105]